MRPLTNATRWLLFSCCCLCFYVQAQPYVKGEQLLTQGQYRLAIKDLQRELSNSSKSNYDKGKIYINLGRCYQYVLAYDSAFTNFQSANAVFKEIENDKGSAEGHIWLLEYYRATSNIHQIRKMDALCEQYMRKVGNDTLLYALYLNRKGAYINQFYTDSIDRAAFYAKRSIAMVGANQSNYAHYIRANGYLDLGLCKEKRNDSGCFDLYKKSFQIWDSLGNKHYAAYTVMSLAQANWIFKKYSEALNYAYQSLSVGRELGLPDMERRSQYLLYLIYDQMGESQKALKALRDYHTIDFFSIPLNLYQTMLETEKVYDEESKRKDVELNNAKIELSNQMAKRAQNERNIFAILMIVLIASLIGALVVYSKIKKDKRELQKALAFNQILLKEVNHRVKNNLTFLKSMLYLKEKYVEEPTTKRILVEFQNRIQAMASVHTELYNMNNDSSDVDLISVLNKNLNEFQSIQEYKGRKVSFDVTGEIANISLEKALPIMLILNELVTNSVKYVDDPELSVSIHFKLEESNLIIEYGDSGPGLSQEMFENSNGFGLRMVSLMLKQLQGSIQFESPKMILTIQL